MDNRFVSERNKLVNARIEAEKNFRMAFRWLMETNGFVNNFREGENWKGDHWTELAEVARETREEAIMDVLYRRKEYTSSIEALVEFDNKAKEEKNK